MRDPVVEELLAYLLEPEPDVPGRQVRLGIEPHRTTPDQIESRPHQLGSDPTATELAGDEHPTDPGLVLVIEDT